MKYAMNTLCIRPDAGKISKVSQEPKAGKAVRKLINCSRGSDLTFNHLQLPEGIERRSNELQNTLGALFRHGSAGIMVWGGSGAITHRGI